MEKISSSEEKVTKNKTMEETSTLKDISAKDFEVTSEYNDIEVPTKTTVENKISTFHPSAETFHENFNQELKNKTFEISTDKDFEAEPESVSDDLEFQIQKTIEVSDNLEPMLKKNPLKYLPKVPGQYHNW